MRGSDLSVSRLNQNSREFLVREWDLSAGKVDLFWVKDGVIRATILRTNGENLCISNIIGIQKIWMSSSGILEHVLSDSYAILGQLSNREFLLRVLPRIYGGGNDSSREAPSDTYGTGPHREESSENIPSEQSEKVSLEKEEAKPSASPGTNHPDTGSHNWDLAAEAAIHIGAEFLGHTAGFVAGMLHTSELNRGENELLAKDFLERYGDSIRAANPDESESDQS